jgi:hypothetical protein
VTQKIHINQQQALFSFSLDLNNTQEEERMISFKILRHKERGKQTHEERS